MNFNIKDFGAVGDGKTLDTSAIQSAIDAAAEHDSVDLPAVEARKGRKCGAVLRGDAGSRENRG